MNRNNKQDLTILLLIALLSFILAAISAIDLIDTLTKRDSNDKEIKQTNHYYLHNNVELSTMEVKDEVIPLTPMSTKSNKLYSKCPMSANYQKWLDKKCDKYDISMNVVLGVMKTESNFKIKASGDNGRSLGLMQIQKRYHSKRMRKLGANNLLNAYDNATVGVDYLAELYSNNNFNWHKTLMAYNGGQAYANRNVRKGIYSTKYSRKVMNKAYEYKANRK